MEANVGNKYGSTGRERKKDVKKIEVEITDINRNIEDGITLNISPEVKVKSSYRSSKSGRWLSSWRDSQSRSRKSEKPNKMSRSRSVRRSRGRSVLRNRSSSVLRSRSRTFRKIRSRSVKRSRSKCSPSKMSKSTIRIPKSPRRNSHERSRSLRPSKSKYPCAVKKPQSPLDSRSPKRIKKSCEGQQQETRVLGVFALSSLTKEVT